MKKQINITHLTSAHPRYDARIFVKECCSLAKNSSYQVSLIVADSLGDEIKDSVHIYDVGKLSARLKRMFYTTKLVLNKAIALDSDIYHFHDPELIGVGLSLKKMGKKVIFDIHEDVKKQILSKAYLNRFLKNIISYMYKNYERYACKKFDYLITPTPNIYSYFKTINSNVQEVRNYPILEELLDDTPWNEKKDVICHIGSLSKTRGISELIDSLAMSKTPLLLAGSFRPVSYEDELRRLDGWRYVDYQGFLSRDEVKECLSKSKIGVVTLHPTQSYLEAIPVKMFEYMASGIVVLSSDFEFYKELLHEHNCAVFVNPLDAKAIALHVNELMVDNERMKEMGENGKKAVIEHFNWAIEEQKLFDVYERLLV